MKQVSSTKTRKENEIMSENLPATQQSSQHLPAYLQKLKQEQDGLPESLKQLQQYWTPDRVKIVQAQSGEQFKKQFNVGDTVLVPQMLLIAKVGQPFWVTPIFMYTEFCVWNPYGLKGQLPVIRERTFDPNSPIARKAKSRKEEELYAICPEAPKGKQGDQLYKLRYCEHINWLAALRFNKEKPDHPAHRHINIPILFSFHHSGFFEGRNLSTLIINRGVHTFAGQYQFVTEDKTNSKGTWKGFTITNPSLDSGMSSFVENEEEYQNFESVYNRIQMQFAAGEIYSGDFSEDLEEENTVPDSAGKF